MATARDKLIADWRERLAVAETAESAAGRPAWLARLQVRLYRILLSLYGDGHWTGSTPADGNTNSVVFDSTEPLPLDGKPAKTVGQIQAVLKSVASAQAHAPTSGPLTDGLTPDCWVTLELSTPKKMQVALQRIHTLRYQGIEARLQTRGDRNALEVRAGERQRAAQVLQRASEHDALLARQRLQAAAPRPAPPPYAWYSVLIGMVAGPLAGYLVTLVVEFIQPNVRSDVDWVLPVLIWSGTSALIGFLAFAAAVPMVLAVTELFDHLRVRRLQFASRRRKPRQILAECIWHCLIVGLLIAPFVGLASWAAAGNVLPTERVWFFLVGWWATLAVGWFLYLVPPLRWLIPWLE